MARPSSGRRAAFCSRCGSPLEFGACPSCPPAPRKKRKRRLPPVVRKRQWEALLGAACRRRDRALMAVMLYGGLRVSEACRLDMTDIDWDEEQIHIRSGKGDKEAYVYAHPAALAELRAYLEERTEAEGKPPVGPIFLSEKKNRLSRCQAWRVIKAAGAAAGCGDIWSHVLRHSCATRMVEAGAKLHVVQAHMRHEDMATTAIYLHLADPELKQAARDM